MGNQTQNTAPDQSNIPWLMVLLMIGTAGLLIFAGVFFVAIFLTIKSVKVVEKPGDFDITMPDSKLPLGDSSEAAKHQIHVKILKDDSLLLEGQQTSMKDLSNDLQQMLSNQQIPKDDWEVVVESEPEVEYSNILDVISICTDKKVMKIKISASNVSPSEKLQSNKLKPSTEN